MTLNAALQLAAYCLLAACALLPRLRMLRTRLSLARQKTNPSATAPSRSSMQ